MIHSQDKRKMSLYSTEQLLTSNLLAWESKKRTEENLLVSHFLRIFHFSYTFHSLSPPTISTIVFSFEMLRTTCSLLTTRCPVYPQTEHTHALETVSTNITFIRCLLLLLFSCSSLDVYLGSYTSSSHSKDRRIRNDSAHLPHNRLLSRFSSWNHIFNSGEQTIFQELKVWTELRTTITVLKKKTV